MASLGSDGASPSRGPDRVCDPVYQGRPKLRRVGAAGPVYGHPSRRLGGDQSPDGQPSAVVLLQHHDLAAGLTAGLAVDLIFDVEVIGRDRHRVVDVDLAVRLAKLRDGGATAEV